MEVKSGRLKHSILTALADKEMVSILDCCMFQSKSVADIIREKNIPHTTAYRKIKSMLDEGLLVVESIQITPDGKKFSLIKSTFRTITVRYEHDEMAVEAEENVDVVKKIAEKLFSLSS